MPGIYTHIPFCVKKCSYCDFLSFPVEGNLQEDYAAALMNEISAASFTQEIDTVYIGGGTPTALPPHLLCKILNALQSLPLQNGAEITVEANPGTVDKAYLQALKAQGVNRLSFGLQTTHPHLLRTISRIHTMDDFAQNYHAAQVAGFDNINIDLMFALPGQTMAEWEATVQAVIALAPAHISAYSLTPAENTPLWAALEVNHITLPGDETDRQMYHHARQALATAGYTHYEISNFARPGSESRHNINCWRRVPYIAFGLGGHSFNGQARWNNAEDMATYLQNPGQKNGFVTISDEEAVCESIILGLRLTEGIPKSLIPSSHQPAAQKLLVDGLLATTGENIHLTPRGLDLANIVFEAFY
ncbi:MAG: radical SAM family heme chaperone HemW [Defluviitaleaceae bacterium]|nr:radical SAM family heme chaperone HemW [Defluviitaleaceae bacterium]